MWTVVMMLTAAATTVLPLPRPSGKGESSVAADGVGAVLEAVSQPTCCLILLTDGTISPSTILKKESAGRGSPWGVGVFEAAMEGQEANVTLAWLSHLFHQTRQVRMGSWCVRVVVVSHDPVFLATFAEWSLKGRLLVWATKLLVVTRLPLPQLHALLSSHWTFSMMNTIFLNLDGKPLNLRINVYTHLPYSPEGAQVVRVASWSPGRGLVIKLGSSLSLSKFSNFYSATVNVTALPFPPFWDEVKGPENTTQYSGTDYMTLATIADAMNFTIYVVPTTTWAEVSKLVEQRVSFMATIYYTLLPDRLERFDYTWVYEYGSMDFTMAPPGIQPQWQSLYYPLSDVVWATVLLALLLSPVVLLLIIRMGERKDNKSRISADEVVHDLTGMLLGQNLPRRLPTTNSSRVLVATWLVFALIIGSAYRGNLTAFLTLPKYPPRPETLEQLVSAVDRITMPPYGFVYKDFFSKSESKVFQMLAERIHIVKSGDEGRQQATQMKQAHLENRRYQQLKIAQQFTREDGTPMLYIGRDSILPGQAAWPIPHDAPYKHVLDRCLMAVVEAGLYERWSADLLFKVQIESRRTQRQQQEGNSVEDKESDSSIKALTLTHLQGAFMLLLLGICLAGLLFIIEFRIMQFCSSFY